MLKKMKLALIGALVLGSTAIASAQNATDRPDTGYQPSQQQSGVQGNPNKDSGENAGGGA
jgi:hypothetical protein